MQVICSMYILKYLEIDRWGEKRENIIIKLSKEYYKRNHCKRIIIITHTQTHMKITQNIDRSARGPAMFRSVSHSEVSALFRMKDRLRTRG